ncbi:MAG: universal stress protein [Actinomycetota bacterium]|nr:universal stress protein [Actinomycetota bacterium]
MDLSTIVVGVDGSPNSEAAVRWAADLAELVGAEVIAVHALGLIEPVGPDDQLVPVESNRALIEELFGTEWCRALRSRRVRFRTETAHGIPAAVLLDAATREGADLLVVGTRGAGIKSRIVIGSTSTEVVRAAHCPVVVVPTPE